MLTSMTKTPQISPIAPPKRSDLREGDKSLAPTEDVVSLPGRIAGSGALDRLVETARDYARHAASELSLIHI